MKLCPLPGCARKKDHSQLHNVTAALLEAAERLEQYADYDFAAGLRRTAETAQEKK